MDALWFPWLLIAMVKTFLPYFLLCLRLSYRPCIWFCPPFCSTLLISLSFSFVYLFSLLFLLSIPIYFIFGLSVSSFVLLLLCLTEALTPALPFPLYLCFSFSSSSDLYYLFFLPLSPFNSFLSYFCSVTLFFYYFLSHFPPLSF